MDSEQQQAFGKKTNQYQWGCPIQYKKVEGKQTSGTKTLQLLGKPPVDADKLINMT